MPTDTYRSDGQVATRHYAADKSDEDIEKAKSADRLTDTSRLGRVAKGGGADMPKPEPGEDAMSPAYRKRLSEWRDKQRNSPEAKGQRKMLTSK